MARYEFDGISRSPFSRRRFLALGGMGTLSLLAACSGQQPAASSNGGGTKNAWGRALPSGAASTSKQILVSGGDITGLNIKSMDFNESVYSRPPTGPIGSSDNFTLPLTRIDKDFGIRPGQATAWEPSSDGMSWTFHLQKGRMWSDGKELTATDYVETFRYTADPKHAWDFTWYWSGIIKNYTEAVKGSLPASQIGVRQGSDPYTLVIDTEVSVPYLPSMLLYSWPLSAAALNKYGTGAYNLNPSTCVTCGPYRLAEWTPDQRVTLGPNKTYSGDSVPYVEQLAQKLYKGGDMLQRFEVGEIDVLEVFPTDLKIAQSDARLKSLHVYRNPQDFRVWYAYFDPTRKPFDDVKVRQAFAHAVDRDQMIKSLLAPLAVPAYGFLMPGFPSAIVDPLKPLTSYDPSQAKRLLSEAGYPNGQGFPEVTFYYYPDNVTTGPVVQALAAGWQQTLGVKINLQQLDKVTFYARMNAKPTQIPFGWVSYGMDYFDASNMLGVYKGGGRHNWNNPQYDNLLQEAGPETNKDKRNQLYAQAQKLLTGEAPAVFVYFALHGFLYQPYFKGSALDSNKYGYDGLEWGSIGTDGFAYQSIHIAGNVDQYRRTT